MAPRLINVVGALSVILMICITFADAKNETSCPRGYKTCDSYARCRVNVWSSLRNCGDCGVKCPWRVPHAFSECRKGQCKLDCKKSWGNCDGNATNGCETSLLTTPAHCGKCATACTAPQNATATCLQGKCQVQCDPGLTKCRSNCTDLQSDKYNCGRCNHVCPDQAATNVSWAYTGICVQGNCTLQACFPVKQMRDLELGDKVAVMKSDGSIGYEDVYVFGHRDASAVSDFIRLTLKATDSVDTRNLELSAFHFVPVAAAAGEVVYKRAKDVREGERMWVHQLLGEPGASSVGVFVVSGVEGVRKRGLYNPYTMGGTIVVDGVVASSHSEWFLDDALEALGLVRWLPVVYQAVLLPVRVLYRGLGKELYVAVYRRLDAQVDVLHLGRNYGGSVVATIMGLASAGLAFGLLSRGMSKKG